jgi:hypothetical protein
MKPRRLARSVGGVLVFVRLFGETRDGRRRGPALFALRLRSARVISPCRGLLSHLHQPLCQHLNSAAAFSIAVASSRASRVPSQAAWRRRRLRRFRFLGHAASISRKASTFNPADRARPCQSSKIPEPREAAGNLFDGYATASCNWIGTAEFHPWG